MIKKFFSNKELVRRCIFTLAVMLVYRIGSNMPVPGINAEAISSLFEESNVFTMMNMIGGGALERMSLFALGVGPYITAGIIIQLLSMDVIPYLSELKDQGIKGKRQTEKITRYVAAVLAAAQAISLAYGLNRQYNILSDTRFSNVLFIAVLLTAGTQFLVWLGDRITVKGVGNGISILIMSGIVSNIPAQYAQTFSILVTGKTGSALTNGVIEFCGFLLVNILILIGVVVMELAVRKVPVHYSTNVNQSQNNTIYMPFKVNSASVIPVIFASSILTTPQLLLSFTNRDLYQKVSAFLDFRRPLGLTVYAVLIFMFCFFYVGLQMDPDTISDDLRKAGGFIPGIRPGSETSLYLNKVLTRITFIGGLSLTLLAILPYLLPMVIPALPASISVGGTGIIIMVGVAIETMKQMYGYLTQDKYEAFKNMR